ncbi:hypothetical protein CP8484711_0178B, partial [Chlamydia psittaci 84-8471/1]
YKH